MPVTEYPWEGPRTYVRPAVTRGSAAGANHSEFHILAGMNRGGDVALCNLSFPGNTVKSTTPTVGNPRITLPVCAKCLAALPAKPLERPPAPRRRT